MKITKLVTLTLTLVSIMIIPSQVVQATDNRRLIVHYVGDYNGLIDDTSEYKIHEDTIIDNPDVNSAGYYAPPMLNIYGYANGGRKDGTIKIPKGVNGTYETIVFYLRIIGNDDVSHQDINKFFKKDEVKDLGYWEQKDGNWYFVQQRVPIFNTAIANLPSYYDGYRLNGVNVAFKDGDFTKHYKSGPCWIKPDANWYHLDSTGKMETGWIKDGGNWYFCWSNGQMASDTYVYGDYVDENGVWDGK